MNKYSASLPILSDLNEAQLKAVNHRDGHLMIVAGPGTGKTYTMTRRILLLSQELQSGENILAITFTSKAALEMKERIDAQLEEENPHIFIGTFHQFCLKVLREFLPQGDFVVAPLEGIRKVLQEAWPDVSKKDIRQLQEKVSHWKSQEFDGEYIQEVMDYDNVLRQENMLDFDDLLLETWQILRSDIEALTKIRSHYRYVFVDEYQDINRIQKELLKQIVGSRSDLTVIGDPNQSIYGFRGSNVSYFENFSEDFPEATKYCLTDNYRSGRDILEASTQVIGRNDQQEVPEVTARLYEQGRLSIYEAPTEKDEAEYVVHQIEKMIGGTSMFSQDSHRVSFGDIAVLYRLNQQRPALEKAFDRMGIPFHTSIGGQEQEDEEICPVRGADTTVDQERVSFLTFHASKGLEFPVVFIIGCEEGLVPLVHPKVSVNPDEERRLFYVGMTRAKQCLYLIHSRRRRVQGEVCDQQPSSFLKDI